MGVLKVQTRVKIPERLSSLCPQGREQWGALSSDSKKTCSDSLEIKGGRREI